VCMCACVCVCVCACVYESIADEPCLLAPRSPNTCMCVREKQRVCARVSAYMSEYIDTYE